MLHKFVLGWGGASQSEPSRQRGHTVVLHYNIILKAFFRSWSWEKEFEDMHSHKALMHGPMSLSVSYIGRDSLIGGLGCVCACVPSLGGLEISKVTVLLVVECTLSCGHL